MKYVAIIWFTIGLMVSSVIAQEHGATGGFTIKIGLIDFFMIQRALMQLPDEHAKETLASLRAQILEQTKGAAPAAPKE